MLELIKSKFSSAEAEAPRNDEPAKTAQDTPGREVWLDQVTVAVGAVDESSKLTRALFTYFLTASAYVAIAVLGTSQETLLLNAGIELPIIGTQVPVVQFYSLAPAILVAFHLNLLIKLWALKNKAEEQTRQLAERFGGKHSEAVHAFRELLYPYDFTMLVAGPRGRQVLRGAMAVVITLTVFLGPVALLFVTMQSFAPVGINWMTQYHGTLIAIDAALLIIFRLGLLQRGSIYSLIDTGVQCTFLFFLGFAALSIALFRTSLWEELPADFYVKKQAEEEIKKMLAEMAVQEGGGGDVSTEKEDEDDKWREPLAAVIERRSIGVYGQSEPTDTLPMERQILLAKNVLPHIRNNTTYCLINPSIAPDICPAIRSGAIVNDAREVVEDNELAGRNRLSTSIAQLCGAASGVNGTQLDLSGRQLRNAQFRNAIAPCVRFSGSDLTRADFRGAILAKADMTGSKSRSVWLNGANLTDAKLWAGDFTGAQLGGADLTRAEISDPNGYQYPAILVEANFTEADLINTYLKAANLQSARLNVALLDGTKLQESILRDAAMIESEVLDANFKQANLSGSVILRSYLSGTDLEYATLIDTSFEGSVLVGIYAASSQMLNTKFDDSFLFGFDIRRAWASGTEWPVESSFQKEMLIFADDACFGRLVFEKEDDFGQIMSCAGKSTRLYLDNDRSAALDLDMSTYSAGDTLIPASSKDNVDAFMTRAACVRDLGNQPIGTDGEVMDLKPCWHQDFRERIQIYACGRMHALDRENITVADLFGSANAENYSSEPNPLVIDKEQCRYVGLGTEDEWAWMAANLLGKPSLSRPLAFRN